LKKEVSRDLGVETGPKKKKTPHWGIPPPPTKKRPSGCRPKKKKPQRVGGEDKVEREWSLSLKGKPKMQKGREGSCC